MSGCSKYIWKKEKYFTEQNWWSDFLVYLQLSCRCVFRGFNTDQPLYRQWPNQRHWPHWAKGGPPTIFKWSEIRQSKINSGSVAGPMGQMNRRPSVWCSKYYFFSWFLSEFFAKILSIYLFIFLKKYKNKSKEFWVP